MKTSSWVIMLGTSRALSIHRGRWRCKIIKAYNLITFYNLFKLLVRKCKDGFGAFSINP